MTAPPGSAAGAGETDLARLLATLRPSLGADRWVFCALPAAAGDTPPDVPGAAALVREAEGWTAVVPAAAAAGLAARGAAVSGVHRRVTLTVHSSLEAVGMMAAVAGALAAAGIPCNPISGYYHDHLFVPADRAADAVAVLERLSAGAAG